MAIKTENLAIVMTDIVGYTEATVQQSRSQIEALLAAHNRILLPVVRRYRGRHVKSIGDALLLVYRSPTDAMLCAMAMQDALYEYNRSIPKDQRIHIRIGASLGEVRVSRGDIFGEPVNLTSRVAGVTPPDEIYLSEALFMAMNKAEVPAQEVGWKELKGIGQPVRIYNIPRFAPPRLVPDAMSAEDLTDLVYPYGGAHLAVGGNTSSVALRLKRWSSGVGGALAQRNVRIALALAVLTPALAFGVHKLRRTIASAPVSAPAVEARVEAKPAPVSAPAPARAAEPAPALVNAEARQAARAPTAAASPDYTQNVRSAKQAYRDGKIDKAEYKRIANGIESVYENEVRKAKLDYRAGRMTKAEYKTHVTALKRKYYN